MDGVQHPVQMVDLEKNIGKTWMHRIIKFPRWPTAPGACVICVTLSPMLPDLTRSNEEAAASCAMLPLQQTKTPAKRAYVMHAAVSCRNIDNTGTLGAPCRRSRGRTLWQAQPQ